MRHKSALHIRLSQRNCAIYLRHKFARIIRQKDFSDGSSLGVFLCKIAIELTLRNMMKYHGCALMCLWCTVMMHVWWCIMYVPMMHVPWCAYDACLPWCMYLQVPACRQKKKKMEKKIARLCLSDGSCAILGRTEPPKDVCACACVCVCACACVCVCVCLSAILGRTEPPKDGEIALWSATNCWCVVKWFLTNTELVQ